jgi:hypothetical protein
MNCRSFVGAAADCVGTGLWSTDVALERRSRKRSQTLYALWHCFTICYLQSDLVSAQPPACAQPTLHTSLDCAWIANEVEARHMALQIVTIN